MEVIFRQLPLNRGEKIQHELGFSLVHSSHLERNLHINEVPNRGGGGIVSKISIKVHVIGMISIIKQLPSYMRRTLMLWRFGNCIVTAWGCGPSDLR